MTTINEILKNTQKLIKEDNTITIKNGKTDCNEYVSQESIALRELIIYSDLDIITKKKIQSILINYGCMFDGSDSELYEKKEIIKELLQDNNIFNLIKVLEKDIFYMFENINKITVMENIIKEILKKYYKTYTIPKENYDNIVYEHKKINNYELFKHHYKCLKNPSLKWNINNSNKYNISVTYKDIKKIILQARDSGGHLDCFGYAHDGTTCNCIVAFVGEKLNIDYDLVGDLNGFKNISKKEEKELFDICDNIWNIVKDNMNKYLVSLY